MDITLKSWLESGCRVIASTQRLARHLAYRYACSQSEAGTDVWVSPDIISLHAWLTRSWDAVVWSGTEDAKSLISTPQTHVLWQGIIRQRLADEVYSFDGLLQPSTLARAAARSRSLLLQYEIPVAALASFPISETQAFMRWMRDYEAVCDKNNWIDSDALPAELQKAMSHSTETQTIVLAGFDDLAPATKSLFAALEAQGWTIYHWAPTMDESVKEPRVATTTCKDSRDEIRHAAHWIRECLEKDPGARAGIVTPDLDTTYEMVWRECTDVFDPAALLPGGDDRYPVFQLSRSRNLADIPVIETALRILKLGKYRTDFDDLSRILRSTHIGSDDADRSDNVALELRLRDRGIDRIDLSRIIDIARHMDDSCGDIAKRLDSLRDAVANRERRMPGSWAAEFSNWLRIMAWPGTRASKAAVDRFREVIGQFGALDLTASAMDIDEALSAFKHMLRVTPFQPPGPETRIEITTPEEAAGFEFDYLWVASLDDMTWPAVQKTDPFIPASLQRQYGVERADSALRLAQVRRMQSRLISSAKQTIMSWPQRREDRDMRASPLLASMDFVNAEQLISQPLSTVSKQFFDTRSQEFIHERCPPPLLPGTSVKGGSRLLELQSACPFHAFAELRLHARSLERPMPGLDARERGSMVHRALELFWTAVGDQKTLLGLDENQLHTAIDDAIESATSGFSQTGNSLRQRLLSLEKTRIAELIADLLELEKERSAFRVLESEQDRKIDLGNLVLSLRIDRVDELDDGREVVLDYKTGKVAPGEWFRQRLPKPQLPLYSVSSQKQPAAVAYVSIRAGDIAFKGVAAEDNLLPGVNEFRQTARTPEECIDWPHVQEYWQASLDALAREFCDGRISVEPARYACDWCHLAAVCRVDELNVRETKDE